MDKVHFVDGIKIQTSYTCPPIPIRSCDWEAWVADEDPETWDRVGQGETENEAIKDLLEKIGE